MNSDYETCSWCTELVLFTSLREAPDGALVCAACRRENSELDYRKVEL